MIPTVKAVCHTICCRIVGAQKIVQVTHKRMKDKLSSINEKYPVKKVQSSGACECRAVVGSTYNENWRRCKEDRQLVSTLQSLSCFFEGGHLQQGEQHNKIKSLGRTKYCGSPFFFLFWVCVESTFLFKMTASPLRLAHIADEASS